MIETLSVNYRDWEDCSKLVGEVPIVKTSLWLYGIGVSRNSIPNAISFTVRVTGAGNNVGFLIPMPPWNLCLMSLL